MPYDMTFDYDQTKVRQSFGVTLGTDVSNTTNVLADCNGLSFPVAANVDYAFQFDIIFQTVATTTGIRLAVTGPANQRYVFVQTMIPTSLTGITLGMHRAYDGGSPSAGVDIANTNMYARITGMLGTGSTSGVLKVRFCSEVNTSGVTIKAGSIGRMDC